MITSTTAKRTSRKPTIAQTIQISQWMLAKSQGEPKTADDLAIEAARELGCKEIAPLTIKRIASQLNIKIRRKPHKPHKPHVFRKAVSPGRPPVARLEAIAQAVVDMYKLAGVDDKTVEEVRSKLFPN